MEHGLFSYNCRHRFIKYEAGTKVPPQYHYDPNKESEASLIDKKMRQMEEEIRKAKERQNLALTPEERKKWQAKSKALQKKYDEFAKAHNRVRNDWRTSIGRLAERPHMKGIEQGSGEPYISPKKSMKEAGLVRSGIEKKDNVNEVKKKVNETETIKLAEITKDKIETCKKLEPTYSKDMKDIEKSNPNVKLYGFEFRLKSFDSLYRKIKSDALDYLKDGYSKDEAYNEASKKIHDGNRYTFVIKDNDFTNDYFKVQKTLEKKGYKLIKCKNTLSNTNSPYRGINNQYELNGNYVEIQFHTKQSIEIKEKNHKLYEISRLKETPDDVKEKLQLEMKENNSKLTIPNDVDNIK